jgi:hypothetical protein
MDRKKENGHETKRIATKTTKTHKKREVVRRGWLLLGTAGDDASGSSSYSKGPECGRACGTDRNRENGQKQREWPQKTQRGTKKEK